MTGYSEEVAVVFDRLWGSYSDWASKEILSIADEEFGLRSGAVLDVGCGTGRVVQTFCRAGWRGRGIDASEHMVRIATERAQALEPSLWQFSLGLLTEFGVEESFNIVTCIYDTLNHCECESDLIRFFAECAKVLVPNGLVVIDFNTVNGLEDWNRVKVTDRADALVVSRGLFIPEKGIAYKRFNGFFKSGTTWIRFAETIHNIPISPGQLSACAAPAGLEVVRFSSLRDLKASVENPEMEDRVFAFLRKVDSI